MSLKNVVKASRFFHGRAKVVLLGGALLGLATIGVKPATGQRSALPTVIGIPEDWSHHRVIYHTPQTAEAAANIQKDPRYWQQWFRRNVRRMLPDGSAAPSPEAALQAALKTPISLDELNKPGKKPRGRGEAGLWGESLGAVKATVGPGNYPAKFTFYNSAGITSASCSDYVAFNTSLAAGGSTAAATKNEKMSSNPTNGQEISIKNGATTTVFVATTGTPTGTQFAILASAQTTSNSLVNVINSQTGLGYWADDADGTNSTITLHATAPGTGGNSISVVATTNIPGFTVGAFAGGANATSASVLAFSNLYTGCGGTVPSSAWAYDAGPGTAATSVTLSADTTGSQVAFVTVSGGNASLNILKWKSMEGSASAPSAPGEVFTCIDMSGHCLSAASQYLTCKSGSTSCLLTEAFDGGPNDTDSAPFVDYFHDILYVGDDSGNLHQFGSVFNGNAVESVTATSSVGWPSTISGKPLLSPVMDLTLSTPTIFVISNGRFLASTTTNGNGTTAPTVPITGALGVAGSISEAPIVDSDGATAAGSDRVYVFGGSNGGQTSVYQFPDNFTNATTQTFVNLGSSTTTAFFDGDFDNTFYTSGSPASPAGNLYACAGDTPILYQIPFATAMFTNSGGSGAVTGPAIANGAATCSPITEFFNNGTDSIFVSVTANGHLVNCNDQCLYAIQLDGTAHAVTATYANGSPTLTATSGSFSASDVGAVVSTASTGIAAGTTIFAVTSSTTATMSANASATHATGVPVTITRFPTTGLNTDNGTSGIIIDNSSSTTGASQVYASFLGEVLTTDTRGVTATTVNGSNVINLTAGFFTASDKGAVIANNSAGGLAAGTTISTVNSSTQATLSAACDNTNPGTCGSGTYTIRYMCPAGGSISSPTATTSCAIQASQAALE